jgi:hypothetical protein
MSVVHPDNQPLVIVDKGYSRNSLDTMRVTCKGRAGLPAISVLAP